jgi:large subunit ribosomal protein L10
LHENRTSYPQKKTQMYQQLQELPKKYKVLSIIQMQKVRSTQILPLRKILKDDVEFVSIKDKRSQKTSQKTSQRDFRTMYANIYKHVTIQTQCSTS